MCSFATAFALLGHSLQTTLTMRFRRLFLGLGVVTGAAACSSSTESPPRPGPPGPGPQAASVTGVWQTDRVLVETYPGSRQTTIVFDAHGQMTMDAREFGVFPGDAPDDVSMLSHTVAAYAVAGDSVSIRPSQIRWWTHLEGANPPEHVLDVTPPALDEIVQFDITGDVMTIRVIAPKEGPPIVYHRAG